LADPTSGNTWASNTVTWSFALSGGEYVGFVYQSVIVEAARLWSSASGMQLNESSDTGADIRVVMGALPAGSFGTMTASTDGSNHFVPGAMVTLEDASSGLVRQDSGDFNYKGTSTNLLQVALQELGHAIGLADNPSDPSSVMNPVLGTSNRTLDQNDIQAIRQLYAATPTPTPTPVPTPTPTPTPTPVPTPTPTPTPTPVPTPTPTPTPTPVPTPTPTPTPTPVPTPTPTPTPTPVPTPTPTPTPTPVPTPTPTPTPTPVPTPTPTPTPLPVPTPTPTPTAGNFTVADQTTGQQTFVDGDTYSGPVAGLSQEVVLVTSDSLNVTANMPNVFIHTGSGTDAIDVSPMGGTNVLDGSTGSNFLTGGSGNDTFFLDDRSPASDVFSTIVNFHSGDNATVFGVNPTDFTVTALDNQGAAGYTGLDFAFSAPGHPDANIVLTGYSVADVTSGRLTVSFGTTPDEPGVPGSQYLNVHAN
jgi:hypothetical protein